MSSGLCLDVKLRDGIWGIPSIMVQREKRENTEVYILGRMMDAWRWYLPFLSA